MYWLQVAAGAAAACPSRSHDGLAPEDRRGRASSSSTCSTASARFAAEAADATGAAAGGHAGVAVVGPVSAASAASAAGRAADRARWEAHADESATIAGTAVRVKGSKTRAILHYFMYSAEFITNVYPAEICTNMQHLYLDIDNPWNCPNQIPFRQYRGEIGMPTNESLDANITRRSAEIMCTACSVTSNLI